MKIILLAVGKTVDKSMASAIENYVTRIKHYTPFEFKILPDIKINKNMNADKQKQLEGKLFISHVQPGDRVVLLDERGKEYTSIGFSTYIASYLSTLQRNLIFIIGGPYGFSEELYDKAHEKISLSKMTLTHEMVRLFFTEQIYRAFTIMRGEPYHHE